MSKKSDKLFSEFWHELEDDMKAKGIEPDHSPMPTKAETIMEMVAAMLWSDHVFASMRCYFHDLVSLPPRPDFRKMIEAAKRNGTFPKIKINYLGGQVDYEDVEPGELAGIVEEPIPGDSDVEN